jgi:ribose/xylose/arabinose/galactoside ABC-type transport system permease subunit
MSDIVTETRSRAIIPDRLGTPMSRLLGSWEILLFCVAVLIFIANSFASPYFLNAWNLSDATFNFTEKAMIAFAMAMLVIAGEIDLSVAAIIALASTAMGAAAQMGIGTPGLVAIGLGVGLACGAVNGALVSVLRLPSIVVTIGCFAAFPISCWVTRPMANIRQISRFSAKVMSLGCSPSNSCCSSCLPSSSAWFCTPPISAARSSSSAITSSPPDFQESRSNGSSSSCSC